MVPEEYQRPYLANPIAAILTEMRHAVARPDRAGAARGDRRLAAPADPARDHRRLVLVAGIWAFRHEAPRIAEHL